jgi:hypothetical protein
MKNEQSVNSENNNNNNKNKNKNFCVLSEEEEKPELSGIFVVLFFVFTQIECKLS